MRKSLSLVFATVILILGVWVGRRPVKANLDTVKLRFFFGTQSSEYENFPIELLHEIFNHPNFIGERFTVIYFHGFVEKMTDEHISVISDAYRTRNEHNLIMVDWSEMAEGSYVLDAVPNAIKIGKCVGEKLVELAKGGFPLNKIHLIGHSLGGQLVGYVGRTVFEKSDFKMKMRRISALDPAFPGFYPSVIGTHISRKDAEFVDIIHTDAWLYGTPSSTGHVDFWPNAGKTLQPGCPKRNYKILSDIDLCSHRRSWFFWAESVKTKNQASFQAVRAKSWKDFKRGSFDRRSPIISMGIDCPSDARGNYYLQTNGEIPFSRGISGVTYKKQELKRKEKNKKNKDKKKTFS